MMNAESIDLNISHFNDSEVVFTMDIKIAFI